MAVLCRSEGFPGTAEVATLQLKSLDAMSGRELDAAAAAREQEARSHSYQEMLKWTVRLFTELRAIGCIWVLSRIHARDHRACRLLITPGMTSAMHAWVDWLKNGADNCSGTCGNARSVVQGDMKAQEAEVHALRSAGAASSTAPPVRSPVKWKGSTSTLQPGAQKSQTDQPQQADGTTSAQQRSAAPRSYDKWDQLMKDLDHDESDSSKPEAEKLDETVRKHINSPAMSAKEGAFACEACSCLVVLGTLCLVQQCSKCRG